MRLCSCCSLPAAPTPESARPMIWPGFYLLLWECSCGSTQAVTLFESEEE